MALEEADPSPACHLLKLLIRTEVPVDAPVKIMALPAAWASKMVACGPTLTGHHRVPSTAITLLTSANERMRAIEASGPSAAGGVVKPW